MQVDVRTIDRLLGELNRINDKLEISDPVLNSSFLKTLDEVTLTLKDLLVLGASSDQVDVRRCSIYGLSKICSDSDINILIAAAGDSDPSVRAWAIEGLGRLLNPSVVPLLIASLGDFDSFVYYSAVLALRRFSPDDVLGPLIEAMNNKNSLVRQRAAKLLGCFKDTRAVAALIDKFYAELESTVRYEIIEALSQIGSARANRIFIIALEDEASEVRCAAIKGLRKTGNDEAIEPLVQVALFDREHRSAAIDALTQLCGVEAIWPIHQVLKEVNLRAKDVAKGLVKTRSLTSVLPSLWDNSQQAAIN